MQIIDKEVNINTDYFSLSFFGEIEITELDKLSQLKKLRHLNLSSSDLFDKHLEVIGQLKSLELLDLDLTEISNKGLSFLTSLQNLKELRLKDNPQITDFCIDYLLEIKSLEFIHLENTSITINGLKKIFIMPNLNSVIIDTIFDKMIRELLTVSKKHPKLEISLKGKALIKNGELK